MHACELRLEISIDMLADLKHRGLVGRLRMVGEDEVPEDRRAMHSRAEAHGASRQVEITVPRPQARDHISQAEIFVSPIHPFPIFDGASLTKLVEYLALGVPVVASARPDQSLILRESRADSYVHWGARFFACAVLRFGHQSDEDWRALGKRGRTCVSTNPFCGSIADGFENVCLRAFGARQRKG